MMPSFDVCKHCQHLAASNVQDSNKLNIYCRLNYIQSVGTILKTSEFDNGDKPTGLIPILMWTTDSELLWEANKKTVSESRLFDRNERFVIPQGCPYELEHVLVNQHES